MENIGIGQFFTYLAVSLVILILCVRLFFAVSGYFIEKFFNRGKKQSFTPKIGGEMPKITPEGREFEIIGNGKLSLLDYVLKKIPSIITIWAVSLTLSFSLGSYISTVNIDRTAASVTAFQAGNTGLALAYLWPMGKDLAKDQFRISSGNHPYLEKNGLQERFEYIGVRDDFHYAMMGNLLTASDIDRTITPDDEWYSKVIFGTTVSDAIEICKDISENVITDIVSEEDWEFSLSHILAKNNIERYPYVVEWFKNEDPEDSDNYKLNFKDNSDMRDKFIDGDKFKGGSKDGIYFDEDDALDITEISFRCIAKWPKGENE